MIEVGGKEYRVVVWTPYGRERTVSILHKYVKRDVKRGIVDEYWLCSNTDPDQIGDLKYMFRLDMTYPWIKVKERPEQFPRRTPKQRNTGSFCWYMQDENTVYVRMDDDLVYIHPDAIERLVRARVEMDASVHVCFPVMWNNSIVSYLAQKAGIIPMEFGEVKTRFCMDPIAWGDGDFAVKIHELALGYIEAGTPEKLFLYQDYPLMPGEQFSVSCFASPGWNYSRLPKPGVLEPDEEESWHTIHRPAQLAAQGTPKTNMVIGNALVSHLTFMNQQKAVFATNILDRYRKLAEAL